MNSAPDDSARALTPGETPRCVWMSAGILSYQLCDRQLECDRCPLDAALRMHFKRPKHEEPPHEAGLPRRLWYSRNHFWIALPGNEIARVGLEPGFSSALGAPKAVVLPAPAEKIRHHEVCAWIVLDGGTLPVRAPLSGTITGVNARLSDQPSALTASPYGEGWLFEARIGADEPVRAHFMAGEDAGRIFTIDVRRFRERLRVAIGDVDVGATLHDGGEFVGGAAAMLGGKRYIEIIREEFGM